MNRRYFCNKILYRVLNFLLDFFLGWLIEASTTFLPSSNFNQLAFGSYRNLKFHLTSLPCISNAQSAERSKNLSCLVLPVQSARSSHVNTARRLYHFTREDGTTQANKKCHDVAYFFGFPSLPMGVRAETIVYAFSVVWSRSKGVSTRPGITKFTCFPAEASSSAMLLVMPATPALTPRGLYYS